MNCIFFPLLFWLWIVCFLDRFVDECHASSTSSNSKRNNAHGSIILSFQKTKNSLQQQQQQKWNVLQSLNQIRGGQQSPPHNYDYNNNNNNYNYNPGRRPTPPQQQQQQQQQQQRDPYSFADYNPDNTQNYEDGFANVNASPMMNHRHYNGQQQNTNYNNNIDDFDDDIPTIIPTISSEHQQQETVQDRVNKWRMEQMEKSKATTPIQELNPRDEQGRLKLLASVSKGSRAMIFGLLTWRDLILYETADLKLKGTLRLMVVVPLISLFLGNLAGVIACLTAGSGSGGNNGHKAKKRFKAILNLDKIVEVLLIQYYLLRLTIFPSKYVPKEIYISGVIHSIFFLIQCQAFTRVTWDDVTASPATTTNVGAEESTEYPVNDDTPDPTEFQMSAGQQQQQQYSGPNGSYQQYNQNRGY